MLELSLPLKGTQSYIGADQATNIIESNLKSYYDWALLSYLGAWTDVAVTQSGIYGGDYSRLRLVADPNYTSGQVWESSKKDWVWETGVNYINLTGATINPQPVGTPVVNGSGYTGTYSINYPQGRVIFNNPVATSATVKIPYATRYVQIYKGEDATWWRQIQQLDYLVGDSQFLQSSSGEWSIMGVNRIQLPAVIITSVPQGGHGAYGLGSDSLIARRYIQFDILAENAIQRNNLMDIFNLQGEHTIMMYNTNTVARSGDYPLDYKGSLVGTKMYPQLVTIYPFTQMRMVSSTLSPLPQLHPNLYMASVRTLIECIV